MTTLKIIPDFENKTAECIGYPSAGEHVDVRIVGAANLLPSSTLRFRVKFGHVTLALFPRSDVNETWETEGDDLKCHLNLNTVQARSVCRIGNTVCHAILDQIGDDEHTVEPTLFFDDLFDVTSWCREPGADEPYDLDLYPNQIADLNQRVNEIGAKVAEAKNAAETAAGSANAAYESAHSAVEAAQNANVRANAAESAAQGAASSAAQAERALAEIDSQVEEARNAATQAMSSASSASDSAEAAEEKAGAAAESAASAASSASEAVSSVQEHAERDDNPHGVTKAQIGLGSVDNTSDMNKPVSHAQRLALELKQDCLSAAQIVAINSGIDQQKVAQIALNLSAISAEIARATNAEAVLRGAIAAIGVMDVVLADELPAAGEQYQRKLYLIPSTNPETWNVKDEFICVKVDNVWGWEQVGSTAITIEFDAIPTEGSQKAARSGGIFSWVTGLLSPITAAISSLASSVSGLASSKRDMTDRSFSNTRIKPEFLPLTNGPNARHDYDWTSYSIAERTGNDDYELKDANGLTAVVLYEDGTVEGGDDVLFNGVSVAELRNTDTVVATFSDTLALTSEVPALSAPSTAASATGKAADAKATGDALAGKVSADNAEVNRRLKVYSFYTVFREYSVDIVSEYENGAVNAYFEIFDGRAHRIIRLPEADFEHGETYKEGTLSLLSDILDRIAPTYSATSAYAIGAKVVYDGALYTCKTAISIGGEAWNAAHWDALADLSGVLSGLKADGNATDQFATDLFGKPVAEQKIDARIDLKIGDVNAVLAAALDGTEVA